MKTHDVEIQLGTTKQTLIYYEKEGLINPSRDENNYRHYTQNDIDILQVILLLRSLEISIDEIKLILSGKLSIRNCLNNKQNYLKNVKEKIEKLEKEIKECTQRTKVTLINQLPLSNEIENNYIFLNYSQEKINYGNNEILIQDIHSIDISLCCSKGEDGRYYFIYNLYFIYIDINTPYNTYSFQIMNNSEVYHFFTYLESLNIVINDPLELIKLFEEKKDFIEIYKYFNKNFSKWQKLYNLEIKDSYLSTVKEYYIDPLKKVKDKDIPVLSIKEQVSELTSEYMNILKKLKKNK